MIAGVDSEHSSRALCTALHYRPYLSRRFLCSIGHVAVLFLFHSLERADSHPENVER